MDKIIIMSDYFEVTTDYILKGIEPPKKEIEVKDNKIAGKILYVTSAALIVIGLLCAFASWQEEPVVENIWGSMIIQVVGIVGYFIGKIISKAKVPFMILYLNITITVFMPLALIINKVIHGSVAPYPMGRSSTFVFTGIYIVILTFTFVLLRKFTVSNKK